METPTLLYQQMIRNIDHARKLVSNVEPNGCKTDLQHLKLRSFVLLTHSIIEEYIEDLGREVAVEARKEFKKGKITKALVALISSRVLVEIREKSRKKIGSDLVRNLDIFSQEAFLTYRNVLDSNNGIQPQDLDNVFLPIGFDPRETNLSLVNALQALGEKRGGLAHKFAISQQLTLSSFETDLKYVVSDLLTFDEEACIALGTNMQVAEEAV